MEPARYIAFAAAAAATLVSLYMAALAGSDRLARHTLAGEDAAQYAQRACGQTAGCEKLAIGPGYDWVAAKRRVIYRVALKPGADLERVTDGLSALAQGEHGVLGWTLRADPVFDVQKKPVAKPSAKPTAKPGKARKAG